MLSQVVSGSAEKTTNQTADFKQLCLWIIRSKVHAIQFNTQSRYALPQRASMLSLSCIASTARHFLHNPQLFWPK